MLLMRDSDMFSVFCVCAYLTLLQFRQLTGLNEAGNGAECMILDFSPAGRKVTCIGSSSTNFWIAISATHRNTHQYASYINIGTEKGLNSRLVEVHFAHGAVHSPASNLTRIKDHDTR